MITIGMNYKVIDGRQDDFIAMFNKVLELMKDIDGHRHSALFADVNEPRSFLIVSEWSDRDQFDAFIGSDRFARVADWGREQILSARPTHTVYTSSTPMG